MAIRRLCGCAVREPRRDCCSNVAVSHYVAELAPRRRDGCVCRPEGLSSRREVRRGQQRAEDACAPRGAAGAGQNGADARDRSSSALRRRPPATFRAGAARRRHRRQQGEGGSPGSCAGAAPRHRLAARGARSKCRHSRAAARAGRNARLAGQEHQWGRSGMTSCESAGLPCAARPEFI
jgi:hypothetical protein